MFFKKIPYEIIIEMLLYLSPSDLGITLQRINKIFYKLSNSNPVWGEKLKEEKRDKKENNANGTENKNTYIKDVQSRKLEYMHYDENGMSYLIEKVLKNLTDIQKAHLGSALVRRLICTEQLTIKEALYNSSPKQVIGLNQLQLRGIKTGLTPEQVNHKWFRYCHLNAARLGIPYKQYAKLPKEQVAKLISQVLRKQGHVCLKQNDFKKALSYFKNANFWSQGGKGYSKFFENGISFDSMIICDFGMIYKKQDNVKAAVKSFWRSLRLSPNYLVPSWNLADININKKDNKEFKKLLDFLIEKRSTALPELEQKITKKWLNAL
ncbi:MAG: hypothetical protein PVG30_03205 [Gammaproteobacteria bacterium]